MYVDVVQCFLDFTVLSIGSFILASKSYNSLSRTYTLDTRIYIYVPVHSSTGGSFYFQY